MRSECPHLLCSCTRSRRSRPSSLFSLGFSWVLPLCGISVISIHFSLLKRGCYFKIRIDHIPDWIPPFSFSSSLSLIFPSPTPISLSSFCGSFPHFILKYWHTLASCSCWQWHDIFGSTTWCDPRSTDPLLVIELNLGPGSFLLLSCQVVSDSLGPRGLRAPAFCVLHYVPEFAQIHIHWVGDTI